MPISLTWVVSENQSIGREDPMVIVIILLSRVLGHERPNKMKIPTTIWISRFASKLVCCSLSIDLLYFQQSLQDYLSYVAFGTILS